MAAAGRRSAGDAWDGGETRVESDKVDVCQQMRLCCFVRVTGGCAQEAGREPCVRFGAG